MKKFTVLIGIVAIILFATIPMLVGLLIDDSSTAARLREVTGQPGLTVNTRSNWFNSIGTVQIESPVVAGVRYEQVRLDADLEIVHGPLLWTEQGFRFGMAWVNVTPVLQGLEDNDLLQTLFAPDSGTQVSLMAGFDGALNAQLRSGPFRYAQRERTFDFEDLQVDMDITRSGAATVGLNSTSVNVSEPLYALTIDALDVELHSASLDASPLPGSLAIKAESAQFNGVQRLTLGGISIDYVAREQADAENAPPSLLLEQRIQVATLESELPVSAFGMQTQLEGVDLKLVTEYLRLQRNLQMGDPDTSAEQLEEVYIEMLREPFTQRSLITATAWGGEHQADLEIIWPGEPTLLTMEQLTLGRVVGLLYAELELRANEEALLDSMFAASVRNYTAQGVLPQDNGDVVITAILQGGNMILNEQLIQLAPFLNIGNAGTP
tara:strand:+ start:44537 stop:45847 length:1311 start_codon:yes stop_codon:yes gene_type:complete